MNTNQWLRPASKYIHIHTYIYIHALHTASFDTYVREFSRGFNLATESSYKPGVEVSLTSRYTLAVSVL